MYANVDDVADRLGRPISDPLEERQVSAWIRDVEGSILARVPNLAENTIDGSLSLGVLTKIIANAVVRKIQNPDGLTSTTVSVDDGSVTKRRDGYRGGDPLELTDGEWAQILPVPNPHGWSTRPSFEPDRVPFWRL